ncbi:MAG TPA: 2-dehydropantoate 2-reductase [Gemmatimonadales bacterium]|nr:2-dehydropantoate 2-reductase [Gemmatimonadales bacterium]
MKIAVIGAGGVGGLLGAALVRSGRDVWFLARGRHLAAMREGGLRITGARGDHWLTHVQVTDRPDAIGLADVVLLAVKLWDVEATVQSLGPLIGPETIVVTLQNGVDAPGQVAATIGPRHVAAGSCFVNGGMTEPGVILQASVHQRIVAGMLTGERSPVLERFGSACAAGDIELILTPAPVDALWEKYVQLVPISAVTALLRAPIGAVRDDPESWRLFLQILEETVLVGRATGADVPAAAVERRLAYVRALPRDAMASMARDLLQGRRLELPWLSGRVIELGRHYGVPTPANDFAWAALEPFVLGADPLPMKGPHAA